MSTKHNPNLECVFSATFHSKCDLLFFRSLRKVNDNNCHCVGSVQLYRSIATVWCVHKHRVHILNGMIASTQFNSTEQCQSNIQPKLSFKIALPKIYLCNSHSRHRPNEHSHFGALDERQSSVIKSLLGCCLFVECQCAALIRWIELIKKSFHCE